MKNPFAGLLRKTPEILGLDIGSSCVKAVQLKPAGRTYRLTALGVAPLAPDVIVDGTIRNPAAVVGAIRRAIPKGEAKGKSAAVSICGRELIIKKVQIPHVEPDELAGAVELEAEHHIPFAIDEVFLDYHKVGERDGMMDLILVAVKKTKVNEYASAVEEAGLIPAIVDVDSFALGNQFEMNFPDDSRDAVALIDIGASIMKTNVVRGGSTIFARDIPFGGNNYTQAISQQLRIPFEQAEAAKLGRDVGVTWESIVPALEAVSRELTLEVQRTFDYFASTAESERIGRIVLSGGCARLAGIEDFLASSWGVPVEVAQPFHGVDASAGQFPEADLRDNGPLFAVAMGLGLRQPGDKPS